MAASSSKNEAFSQNSFSDNGSLIKPPKFNPNNFSLWKSRMMLFMEGMDSKYPTILNEGPIVPRVWSPYETKESGKKVVGKDDSDDSSDEEKSAANGRFILKNPKKFSDEEKRLVSLDSKVRSIIALSLPDEVYHSLVNLSTAKEMWSTLCVLYEGTNEVKKSRKISLVRKYELFSHEEGESLSNYYNRFNSLLNDLKLLGRVYDNEEILCKFMDCLPGFWENICTCIKTTKDLNHMPLSSLYGTLFNYEQTKLQKYLKNYSLALLSDSSKKSKCIPEISYPSDSDHDSQEDPNDHSEANLSDAEDECEETSVDILSDKMAMLDGYSKSKSHHLSGKSKFGRKSSSSLSKLSSLDKSNGECFNCGKKGHFASECKTRNLERPKYVSHRFSKNFGQSSSSASFDRAERYKEKYKREKERNERLVRKAKGLPSKSYDLADESTSESE